MTKAQDTYERIEALIAAGRTRAEAFRELAAEFGQPVDSIRGAYYLGRRQANGDTGTSRVRRTRKRETTAQDAVVAAVATLENAIEAIGREVETARERAEESRAEYEAMEAASGRRIEEIQAKIAVLTEAEQPAA